LVSFQPALGVNSRPASTHVIKNIFKYKKTRYKGLAKNDAQLNMLFALSNLYMVRGQLRP